MQKQFAFDSESGGLASGGQSHDVEPKPHSMQPARKTKMTVGVQAKVMMTLPPQCCSFAAWMLCDGDGAPRIAGMMSATVAESKVPQKRQPSAGRQWHEEIKA